MVSEIKGTGPQTTLTALDPSLRKVSGPAEPAGPAAAKEGEVVTLTDFASRLQQLSDSVAQVPEVDHTRVAELKKAIESGEYRVDDKQVADKMASFESLLTSPHGTR